MRIMLYFYFNTYLFSSHPKPLKIVTQLLSDYGLVEELFHVKNLMMYGDDAIFSLYHLFINSAFKSI